MKKSIIKQIIVVSQSGLKLDEIKKAFQSSNKSVYVSYTKTAWEALMLIPKKAPYLLITSGIVGYRPLQLGEVLIKDAKSKNRNGTTVLVTSEKFDKADYVVKTKDANDGGVDGLKKVLSVALKNR